MVKFQRTMMFQSTPPAWEATASSATCCSAISVSIHASRVGGDIHIGRHDMYRKVFQSTPPAWEATREAVTVCHGPFHVSIHASRVGGDRNRVARIGVKQGFNPRLPRGRRLYILTQVWDYLLFQSTPPAWEATRTPCSHAHRAPVFQSTPPAWEATVTMHGSAAVRDVFQSTPPAWEATSHWQRTLHIAQCFNPRLPRGRRPEAVHRVRHRTSRFQSTPPAWEATRQIALLDCAAVSVSIHASRVGGDACTKLREHDPRLVSIHASRVGGDGAWRNRLHTL